MKVLITGATGFVGSALAANFLARSIPVVALSRKDPDGARTVAAVRAAAGGFGLDIGHAIPAHLQVIDVTWPELEKSLPAAVLAGVTHAWHCAAEMSYLLRPGWRRRSRPMSATAPGCSRCSVRRCRDSSASTTSPPPMWPGCRVGR
ncbi:NAD-dependent epimerase/dehydratase family protein [Massilia sp. H-1]|nr:NAD-dependent epimerase/dehydratase family protein [Massilia sp. H-1]